MGALIMAGVLTRSSECTLGQLLDEWELAWLETATATSLEVALRWAARLDDLEEKLPHAAGAPRSRDEIEADMRRTELDLLLAETDYVASMEGARLKRLELELRLATARS